MILPESLDGLVERIAGRSVLVVGDLMIDHFVYGRVTRISPEAPVPVVQFEREDTRLGGAANVANNIAALGGRAAAVGVVGVDDEAARLRTALEKLAVGTTGIVADDSRCTTRKLRVVTTRNQQVARIDYESEDEIGGGIEDAVVEQVIAGARHADAVLISDYLKGVVSRRVAQACMAEASRRGIPVLVDPKVPHIDYYEGATVITPNHHEAESITHMRIRSAEEARAAAARLKERARCESVLITRGEHGMWLLGPDGEVALRAEAREVSDVTGAGDTVIAALALGLAAGASLEQAARLANRAAGIVVGKFGPATVAAKELRARPMEL
jgi:D-beta-D-heptose 7-phosphate kinase/D-beta-D-heptose 1-phosphate adenosyltransferase